MTMSVTPVDWHSRSNSESQLNERMDQEAKTARMEDQSASIEEFAVEVSDYLIDNEPTYQMMSYFMTKNDMEPQILNRFNTVSRYFLDPEKYQRHRQLTELAKRHTLASSF